MLIIKQTLNGIISPISAVLTTLDKVHFRLICKIKHGRAQTK
jgi:hypothetical protein